MKPLSREASDALSALKSPEPSAADEARVRKNLERTLGMVIPVAGVAAGATAATAQAATGAGMSGAASGATALSLGAKVAGIVLAVSVGTTVTVVAARSAVKAPAPVPVKEVVVAAVPKQAAVQEAAAPPQVAQVQVADEIAIEPVQPPQPLPVKPPSPVRSRPAPVEQAAVAEVVEAPAVVPDAQPPATPPTPPANTQESYDQQIELQFPSCDPATEMRSALNARKLLAAERAEEAVGLLEAYQRRCPSGRWSNEAWTVRLGGLCVLGRDAEARGFLEWFSSESPERRAAVVGDLHQWCSADLLKQ